MGQAVWHERTLKMRSTGFIAQRASPVEHHGNTVRNCAQKAEVPFYFLAAQSENSGVVHLGTVQ